MRSSDCRSDGINERDKGTTLVGKNGRSNKIIKVDWSCVERITSNDRPQRINIEIFKKTVNHLLRHGSITRAFINDEYSGRASSGVVLILAHTPKFELTENPTGLKLTESNSLELSNKTTHALEHRD
jgi:hypothetical protein